MDGPWNSGSQWQKVDDLRNALPVDGGDGVARVNLPTADAAALRTLSACTMSQLDVDPSTGADLGAGPGAGKMTDEDKGGPRKHGRSEGPGRSGVTGALAIETPPS